MKYRWLGSLFVLGIAASAAFAQAPVVHDSPGFAAVAEVPWQPPQTDQEDRPNIAPKGFAVYGDVDYLLWWTERDSPALGSLFRQGTQGTLGTWLDPQQRFGVEIGGLWLDNRYPGWRGGEGDVGIHNDLASRLWGAEIDGRAELARGTWSHLDLLAGFRHLSLDESLDIAERDFADGEVSADRFATRNRFYGGQLGLEAEAHYASWSVDLFAKAALGANCAVANVNGTTIFDGHATPGGLLAAPGLAGSHSSAVFSVLPEIGVHFAYELMNNLRLTAGYSFLYLSNAARPAEEMGQVGSHGPLPATNGEFWGQGITLGLEFRF